MPSCRGGWRSQLAALGHDVVHTLDLPLANRTSDQAIQEIASQQDRVVITKDRDFVISFVLCGEPVKLLFVSTGNLSNRVLEALFARHFPQTETAPEGHRFVELSATQLTIHA